MSAIFIQLGRILWPIAENKEDKNEERKGKLTDRKGVLASRQPWKVDRFEEVFDKCKSPSKEL